MKSIDRTEAIIRISKSKIKNLTSEERESRILDWWSIDEEDDEFHQLSADLQNLILSGDDPINCDEEIYDQILLLSLTTYYIGISNQYIEREINEFYGLNVSVYGEVEDLEKCPCCSYKTLLSRGDFEICRLCNWEDNGTDKLDNYSGPNHKTLREGKKEFIANKKNYELHKWLR